MCGRGETIARLYHAAGTGKTVAAIMEAKRCGGGALFLAHTQELVGRAAFDFLIVDEAHHAAADTYQKILAFFCPAFTLGPTATPERNRLIVGTWLRYVQNKRAVALRAFVWHAEEIAELFRQAGVSAAAASSGMKQSERKEFQDQFIRRMNVRAETIERCVREGKLIPDLAVPMSEHRTFKYFKDEMVQPYAR